VVLVVEVCKFARQVLDMNPGSSVDVGRILIGQNPDLHGYDLLFSSLRLCCLTTKFSRFVGQITGVEYSSANRPCCRILMARAVKGDAMKISSVAGKGRVERGEGE
jgi:hypothetical protein